MNPRKKPLATTKPKLISAHKHKDSRANIPTEELRDFVADLEKTPTTLLYPRDPSLDPQLVWRGKDEQDVKGLEIPAVPIYIQEKIQPQAIIEDLRRSAKTEDADEQIGLFADFNGIEFEEMIEFYRHEQHWQNRMILGDSLLVMTSLAEKEGLRGKVQTIYVDPPYGIKFGSNWQSSTRRREVKDGAALDMTREPEQVRAFRDTWELGIHSYLSYLRDRFVASRELLAESGAAFVQIGDENVHLVRAVLDEVFGAENFVAEIFVEKTSGASMEFLDRVVDVVLFYAKDRQRLKYRQLFREKDLGDQAYEYKFVVEDVGQSAPLAAGDALRRDRSRDYRGVFAIKPLTSQTQATTTRYDYEFRGRLYSSGKRQWATPVAGMDRIYKSQRIEARASSIGFVRFFNDFTHAPYTNSWSDTGTGSFTDPKVYVVQTGTKVIERCILMTTDPGDLVLDPTCGSGTTAYVAEQWGRRWITIDTSRVALALARTRLMAAKFPYYHLADSPEGVRKEAEITGKVPPESRTENDLRRGFVYRRVPHITLKSIANNPEIDQIHERWQPGLDELRGRINAAAGSGWEEWEVPRSVEAAKGQRSKDVSELAALLEEWWRRRRERQKEIDEAIARYADTEILYDQPYEDAKRVRVTGPFTVESLSPHRMLPADDEQPASETVPQREPGAASFETQIIDNLKKAGVQNTKKGERLAFTFLEPHAGTWIHAAGTFEQDGAEKRVAVSIGPEFGAVTADQIKEAAKEAVRGMGYDLLVVCGFAFEPQFAEEAKRYGTLTVLTAKINPDLMMGDEVLKKTGAGNLFMVFGEPDVAVHENGDELTVELRGVDIYDPTTGEVRSSSTDDIACWFIDTNYNGESFFVRHAYFTGAGEPYDKLKRALRAEIDESAWAALYSTISRTFPRPATGKIAVKVINHYGDEVMRVWDL